MWQIKNNSLYRQFRFSDFKTAFGFMEKVAAAAEAANHHPRWLNEWNSVEIWLSSHDAGGKVTQKDRHLADQIDKIAGSFNENT